MTILSFALCTATLLGGTVDSSPSPEKGITLPFTLDHHHLILTAAVEGQEGIRLVLDSGMPVGGLLLFGTERVAALGLEPSGQVLVGGAGGGAARPAGLVSGMTARLGELLLEDQSVIVLDAVDEESGVENPLTAMADGIIGLELFRRFVVEIDFPARRLTLTAPDAFEAAPEAKAVPLEVRGGFPFVELTALLPGGEQKTMESVVDLGAGHVISFELPKGDGAAKLGRTVPWRGQGVQGEVRGELGRIEALHLGPFTLARPIVSFSAEGAVGAGLPGEANLGGKALRRFHVAFDYAGGRLLLEPNARFTDPFETDMSGLLVDRTTDGRYRVIEIVPDTPAAERDLVAGDLLIEIDGEATPGITRTLLGELLQEEGAKRRLVVLRGEERLEITLVLRRLL